MKWSWWRSKSLISKGERALDWPTFASMFRPSPENVAVGLSAPIPPRPLCRTKAYPDNSVTRRITMEPLREQARASQVQDRPPPQGQPVGPAQEPDQQARIWSRPA